MKKHRRWDTHEYEDMARVWREGDRLNVCFRDGAEVQVAIDRLIPPGVRGANWEAMTYTPYHIIVPTADEDFGIPWDVIRVLTDPEFDAYLTERGVESLRQTGARLQELRQSRNLTLDDVAQRSGIPATDLERIEQGDPDLVTAHSTHLLEAMGLSHDALFTPAVKPRKRKTVA